MAYDYSSSAMDDRLKKVRGDVYKAQAQPQTLPEYDYARQKVTEQVNSDNQTEQDALKRRFAAMGALNSGSAIKQFQLQNDSADQKKMGALEGINVQEAQAKRALEQQQQQMEFQSAEGARGRAFGAEESGLGREFQSSEAQKARASQEQMFNSDVEFKKWATELQNNTALKQISVDMYNSAYNAAIQAYDTSDDHTVDEYVQMFLGSAENRNYYKK